VGHLSPRELYEGNLEGEILNWEPPKDILSKTLDSIGASLLGNTERRSFSRSLERREKCLYVGKYFEEFERYVTKAL